MQAADRNRNFEKLENRKETYIFSCEMAPLWE